MLRDYKDKRPTFKSSRFRKGIIATATAVCLAIGLSSVPVTQNGATIVEAKTTKKDKKRPVITFSGKAKLTVEQNKFVKIPKTTAKDNKDGNVTKKLKVTVKKGTKSYSKIAKAIKSNKKVKFTATGKYVITYTVTDKAGNKATKKRYVTVEKKKVPTTEAPTTETPTTEEKTVTDYSKYDVKKITVNGNTYNITRHTKFGEEVTPSASTSSDKIKLKIENDYDVLMMDSKDSTIKSSEYLKYFGKISATDANGNDISDRIVIVETVIDTLDKFRAGILTIYVEDSKGNKLKKYFEMNLYDFDDSYTEDYFGKDYKLINSNPKVYARYRTDN